VALIPITPPEAEPVSLAELKDVLRVDAGDTSQDNVILSLATAARAWAETYTRRRFVRQTWQHRQDCFPLGYEEIVLPLPPVEAIDLFEFDAASSGDPVELVAGVDYQADIVSNPARLRPEFGKSWPVAQYVQNAVRVTFTVGYALPLTANPTSPPSGSIQSDGYVFQATDVGRPISIPGAGANGATLNTAIAAISSPPSTVAELRDSPATAFLNSKALLVNTKNGNPAHWAMIKAGISMLVSRWFDKRLPDETRIPATVMAVLSPVRDLRF
jgi:uncharacterized phiE125 gp8 family phage protein